MGAVNYDGMSPVALMAAAERVAGGEWSHMSVPSELWLLIGDEDSVASANACGQWEVWCGERWESGNVGLWQIGAAAVASRAILEHQDTLRARSTQTSPPSALQEEWAIGWGRHFDALDLVVPTRVIEVGGECQVRADKLAHPMRRVEDSMYRVAREFGKWVDRGGAPFFAANRQPMGAPEPCEATRHEPAPQPRPVTPPQRIKRIRYGGAR